MSLIMAIIIAVIILSVKGFESSQRNISTANFNRIQEKRREFEDRYVDQDFEHICCDLIDKYYFEKQNIAEIERVINKIKSEIDGISLTKKMILCAVMAENCKIPSGCCARGINNKYAGGGPTIPRAKVEGDAENLFKFLKWYNRKLIENGMDDDELYFLGSGEASMAPYGLDFNKKVSVASMTKYEIGGIYFWNGCRSIHFHSGEIL